MKLQYSSWEIPGIDKPGGPAVHGATNSRAWPSDWASHLIRSFGRHSCASCSPEAELLTATPSPRRHGYEVGAGTPWALGCTAGLTFRTTLHSMALQAVQVYTSWTKPGHNCFWRLVGRRYKPHLPKLRKNPFYHSRKPNTHF